MSISNQKLMLRDFAEKNGMFQYEYYVDDGYTCDIREWCDITGFVNEHVIRQLFDLPEDGC